MDDGLIATLARIAAQAMGRRREESPTLDQRRAAQVSENMSGGPWANRSMLHEPAPTFVAEYRDASGGDAAAGAEFQAQRAADIEGRRLANDRLMAEETRLAEFDEQNADPYHWDGRVRAGGTVEFRDTAARGADTPHGRARAAEVEALYRRSKGRQC